MDVLSADELRALFPARTDRSEGSSESSLTALFERQVRANPAAVALTDGEVTLTYGELNARANRLAHALIDRGWGRSSAWHWPCRARRSRSWRCSPC